MSKIKVEVVRPNRYNIEPQPMFKVSVNNILLKINILEDHSIVLKGYDSHPIDISTLESCLAKIRGFFGDKENKLKYLQLYHEVMEECYDNYGIITSSSPTNTIDISAFQREYQEYIESRQDPNGI